MTDLARPALIVAHPGHELTVYHWVERHQPLYFCLTDGSGGNGSSRLESTRRLLDNVGARPAPIFGRYTDREMYQLLLDGRLDVFIALRDELADCLIAEGVRAVAGDAAEGINPVHDVCRALIDAAAALVEARTGRPIVNEEFALDDFKPPSSGMPLDERALQRKLAAANSYPEIQREIEWATRNFGRQRFAIEHLRPSSLQELIETLANRAAPYEEYGRERVTSGRYREVIRYHQHVSPVFAAIGAIAVRER